MKKKIGIGILVLSLIMIITGVVLSTRVITDPLTSNTVKCWSFRLEILIGIYNYKLFK